MLVLKLISAILGVAFSFFGYLIFYKNKYSLINGFDADYKAGRKTEDYAKRVGLTELVLGAAILFVAMILLIFIFYSSVVFLADEGRRLEGAT